MRIRWSNLLILLCCGAVTAALVYLFYATPLRDRVENKLFDLRSRMAPISAPSVPVVVVTIDQASVATLDPSASTNL